MRRIFSSLLLFFPARFRRAFGSDMLATFDERWRERRSVRTAFLIIVDMVSAGTLERFCRRRNVTGNVIRPQGDGPMTMFMYDLKSSARNLMRSPAFAIVTLATLALGIGAATA